MFSKAAHRYHLTRFRVVILPQRSVAHPIHDQCAIL